MTAESYFRNLDPARSTRLVTDYSRDPGQRFEDPPSPDPLDNGNGDQFLLPAADQPMAHETNIRQINGRPPPPLGFLAKFGVYPVTILCLASAALTAAVGVLSWVWFGDRDQELWRQLVLGPGGSNYVALVVTVSSVALRLGFAAFAYVTAAMAAAVVVERHGVPADRIPHASLVRYTGAVLPLAFGGFAFRARTWFRLLVPLQLLVAVASQFSSTILFADFGTLSLRSFPYQRTVRYTFANYSTSTSPVPLFPDEAEDRARRRGYPPAGDLERLAQLATAADPSAFETFAEHAEPDKRIRDSSSGAVDDTGPVWRAFLPFRLEEEREGLEEYTGMLRVFDARTICVRPELENLHLANPGDFAGQRLRTTTSGDGEAEEEVVDDPPYPNHPVWAGRAVIDGDLVPDLLGYEPGEEVSFTFECPVLMRADFTFQTREDFYPFGPMPKDEWGPPVTTWVRCDTRRDDWIGDPGMPGRIPSLDPIFYNKTIDWDNADMKQHVLNDRVGRTYLIMEPGHRDRDHFPKPDKDDFAQVREEVEFNKTEGDGPWAVINGTMNANITYHGTGGLNDSYQIRPFNIPIKATLCFDVMPPVSAPINYLNLTAKRRLRFNQNAIRVGFSGLPTEPQSIWRSVSANSTEYKYDTTKARSQLGAATKDEEGGDYRTTYAARDVLELDGAVLRAAIDTAVETTVLPDDVATTRLTFDLLSRHGSAAPPGRSVAFCAGCRWLSAGEEEEWYDRSNLFWEYFFTDAVAETGSPARAVQAVNTALARMSYMRWLQAFGEEDDATVVMRVESRAPARAVGFGVVVAMLAVQLVIFAVVAVMFRATTDSTLDNAWQVVAQVSSSPAVADILAQAPSDKAVTKLIAEERGSAGKGMQGVVDADGMGSRSTGLFRLSNGTFRRLPR